MYSEQPCGIFRNMCDQAAPCKKHSPDPRTFGSKASGEQGIYHYYQMTLIRSSFMNKMMNSHEEAESYHDPSVTRL